MKRYLAIIITMLCASGAVQSQDDSIPSTDSQEYREDATYNDEASADEEVYHNPVTPEELSARTGSSSEAIDVNKFEHDKWRRVVNGEDYSESADRKKGNSRDDGNSEGNGEGTHSRKRFAGDDEEEYSESSSNGGAMLISPLVKYIFYALVIGIIGYILTLIIKNISLKKSGKKIIKSNPTEATSDIEDIKQLEVDKLLREALESGNYRLAIRIYFLGLLQKLDEEGLIRWKKDKTNRDYLTELFSKDYFDDVRKLTLAYELVWYGDHNLSIPTYEQIISDFKAVDQKLKTSAGREKE